MNGSIENTLTVMLAYELIKRVQGGDLIPEEVDILSKLLAIYREKYENN